mmetsp:Transcript_22009/g.23992  ORF Transcript_22009/g.23992 Transcript_22009/m.23992 type:complete len:140 (+) Transcript_22009:1121-1540(+)
MQYPSIYESDRFYFNLILCGLIQVLSPLKIPPSFIISDPKFGRVRVLCLAIEDFVCEKDSYVGVDRHSGVLIGNRSLWHNKSKIVSDYGPGFTSNSIIILRYDSNKGLVTFRSALTSSAVTSLSRTTENNATVEGAEIF